MTSKSKAGVARMPLIVSMLLSGLLVGGVLYYASIQKNGATSNDSTPTAEPSAPTTVVAPKQAEVPVPTKPLPEPELVETAPSRPASSESTALPPIQVSVTPAARDIAPTDAQPLLIDFRHSSNGISADSIAAASAHDVILLDFLISDRGILALDAKTTATDPTVQALIDEWDKANVGAINDPRLLGQTFRLIGHATQSSEPTKFSLTQSTRNGIAVDGSMPSRIEGTEPTATETLVWQLVSDAPIRLDFVGWSYGHSQSGAGMQIKFGDQIETHAPIRLEAGYLKSTAPNQHSLFAGTAIEFSQAPSARSGTALSGMVFTVNYGDVPSVGYKNGITIMHRNFPATNEKAKAQFAEMYPNGSWEQHLKDLERKVKAQFDTYRDLGIELLRLPGGLTLGELNNSNSAYTKALREYDEFDFKVIIDTAAHVPLVNSRNQKSNHVGVTNIWDPKSIEKSLFKIRREINHCKKHKWFWDRIAYLTPQFGPMHEIRYPSMPHYDFWCYGDYAQADFRSKMQIKYQDIHKANRIWNTEYSNWDSVVVAKPGQGSPEIWEDILTWYRDSKRAFALQVIRQIKEVSDKDVLIYVAGGHFNQNDWNQAVESSGRHANNKIRMMLDSDWIIKTATKEGCVLQYTGLSRSESFFIKERARVHGYDGPIYGENPGHYGSASYPVGLASIINETGFSGIDYTWNTWIFGDGTLDPTNDMETRNALYWQLKEAYRLINAYPKNPTLQPRIPKMRPEFIRSDQNLRQWAWTILPEITERKGLQAMYHGFKFTPPPTVTREGLSGFEYTPQNKNDSIYVAITEHTIGMGKTPRADIYVRYFDEGHGQVSLQYDSEDPDQPYKEHPDTIQLSDSKRWKTALFRINDAQFTNRVSGRDFRLRFGETERFIVRSMGVYSPDVR
ncbi:Unannotated [Lentimonas sp. CC4]|nr:Unannotated [Lentimonas sp. CC4]CAA6686372.1 Unannotated [Lentimonas sp. CC6]CAA7076146.1 Unannotated [Lentimonas sp. CC4]CAA7170861.1 Unannotated [Lentimonas sp. CC21]CAA7181197.1 Unannotated [Lentimonas sp. CC8]